MLRCVSFQRRPGFLLVEVLLGMAIFALFLGGLSATLIYGQENTIRGGDRTRASYLTERTIEAVRAIRDASFASVTTGTKGVWVNRSTGLWAFSGSQVTVSGSYTISVSIASKASGWLAFTGTTVWKHGYNRSGIVQLIGEMTDWKSTQAIGNWSAPTVEGTAAPGGSPQFTSIAVAGNTAYVTCNASTGLYMFDISNTASPTRIGSSFTIGYGASSAVVRGSRLYVLTADSNAELKIYNISTPSSPTLITSYNLPGNGIGTSLAMGYNMLYVTASYSATAGQSELYGFDISSSGSVVLKSTVDDTDSLNALALTGTSAYLASAVDTAELQVAKATLTGGLSLAGGYNLTDRTLDAQSIAVSGTSAILGTMKGSSIQEMVLFDIGNGGVPSGSSGPWYHEGSGTLKGVALDPYRCYGFLAADSGKKALQIVDIRNKTTLPELYSYNSSSGVARGLFYDLVRDRLYLLTDSAVLIFKPSSSGGTCP